MTSAWLTRRQCLMTLLATFGSPSLARSQTARAGSYRYLHYDVFTDTALTGNQLAVFTNPAGLSSETMAAMTREMNYSECTFIFPAEQAGTDIRLRIFGLGGEMQFAGHPVIGSTFALAHEGIVKPGRQRLVFGLGLGPTPVDLEWRGAELAFAWMTQQRPTFGSTLEMRDQLAAALGIDVASIRSGLPVQEVSCGSAFMFVPLTTRKAVDQCAIDPRAVEAVFKQAGIPRRGLFVFSTEPGDDGATAYSRMLGGTGREDPATGSASGPLGCYLVKHGLVAPDRAGQIVSRQGVKMGRPSRIHIRIATQNADITDVKVGGTSVLVGDGRIVRT
jgi:trans-2,3-dihydro-3-hydroxyanthranilate isomerase